MLLANKIIIPLTINVNNVVNSDNAENEDNPQIIKGEINIKNTGNNKLAPIILFLGFNNGSLSKKRKVGNGDQ